MKQIDVKGTLRNLVVFVLIVFSVYAGLVIHNNKQEFKEYQYQAYQADVAKNLESAQIELLNLNFGTALAKARTAREVDLTTYYKCYVTYPLNKLSQQIKGFDSKSYRETGAENSSSSGYTTLIGDVIDALKE